MLNYSILLSKKAEKYLDTLSDKLAKPILEALSNLSSNPRPSGYIKLKGRSGFRIRVGDNRIIYYILEKELIIDVIAIGHRKDVYL